MARPDEPVFLERQSYRRRRLTDAAKILPIIGLVLMFLPLLWGGEGRTAGGLVYIFAVWAILICVGGALSFRLSDSEPEDTPPEDRVG